MSTRKRPKHSPGPWSYGKKSGWGFHPVITAAGEEYPIASLIVHKDAYYRHATRVGEDGQKYYAPTDKTPEGEARREEVEAMMNANARLMAAAPDLLEALQVCLDALPKHAMAHHWEKDAANKARAAIAKATGETR